MLYQVQLADVVAAVLYGLLAVGVVIRDVKRFIVRQRFLVRERKEVEHDSDKAAAREAEALGQLAHAFDEG